MQRPTRRPQAAGLALLIAGSLLVSGCIQVGFDSDFSNPDQIRHTLQYTIDRANIGQVQQSGGALGNTLTNQDQARQNAQGQGFQFEPINTADKVGARISTTLTAQQQNLGTLLNQFLSSAVPTGNAQQQGFSGSFTRDGNTYTLQLVIDADQLFAQPGGAAVPAPMNQIVDAFTYTARMPGTLKESSGALLPDGRLQWTIPVTGTTTITASSTVKGGGSSSLLLAGIGGGALLFVILLAAYVIMRRRAAPMHAGGPPGGSPPPVTPAAT